MGVQGFFEEDEIVIFFNISRFFLESLALCTPRPLPVHSMYCYSPWTRTDLRVINMQVNDLAKAAAVMSLATPMLFTESAQAATEMMNIAAGDARTGLLAFPVLAALGWVGFNIAGPALNQLNDMSDKKN